MAPNSARLVAAHHHETSVTFQGPIPPPELLAKYNDIEPGLAGRIMTMAEKEQAHRHEMGASVVDGTFSLRHRGQNFAFAIAILGLLISGTLIYFNRTTGGSILGGATLSTLVIAFLTGRGRAIAERSKAPEDKQNSTDPTTNNH